MVENNSADNTLERTLCHGTLQVSSIHQNTSYVICCITTRPKLLINNCVKINELQMISYCPFLFSILCNWYNFMLSFQGASALSITGLAKVFFFYTWHSKAISLMKLLLQVETFG